ALSFFRLSLGFRFLAGLLFCGPASERVSAADSKPASEPVPQFFAQHCQACHNGLKAKGNFRLESLTPDFADKANRERWLTVLEQLKSGTMPPEEKPRPSESEAKRVTEWIREGLVAAEKQRNATQGRALLRRLNRIEYNNTINDLLGTDIKLLDRLPQDGSAFGFDTVDVGLDMAGPTLERYIQAADVALDAALAHGPRPPTLKHRFEINEKTKDLLSNGKRLNPSFFSLQCLVQSDRVVYFSAGAASPPETWRVLHSG